MLLFQLCLLYCAALLVTQVGEATPEATPTANNFGLSLLEYHDYNSVTTVCSYRPGLFGGNLHLSLNGTTDFISNKTHFFGCGTITVSFVHYPQKYNCSNLTAVPDCSESKWNISLILHGCDQVLLQCGNRGSDKSEELSSSVTLRALERQLRVNVTLPDVVCETYGILEPRILWFIDEHDVTVNITIVANDSDVELQMWYSAAAFKLWFNESFAFNYPTHSRMWCAHQLSDRTLISSVAVPIFNNTTESPTINPTVDVNVTVPSNSSQFGGATGSIGISSLALTLCLGAILMTLCH